MMIWTIPYGLIILGFVGLFVYIMWATRGPAETLEMPVYQGIDFDQFEQDCAKDRRKQQETARLARLKRWRDMREAR